MTFHIKSFTVGIIAGLMGSVVAFGAGAVKSAEIQKTEISIDGKLMAFGKPALMVAFEGGSNNNIYAPLEEVLENAGYQAVWHDDVLELTPPHPAMAQSGQELLAENKKAFPSAPDTVNCGYRVIYTLSSSGNETPEYDKFMTLMDKQYNIQPVYLPLGSEVEILFNHDIENMEIYSFVLNENGGMKYNIPNPLNEFMLQAYEMSDNKFCIIKLQPNTTSGLSSLSYDYYEGNTLLGYLLRYECQGEKIDTFFVVKTDAGQ